MKKINVNKKIYIFLAVIFLTGLIGINPTVSAKTEKRSANIKSKGIIDFKNGTAVIDFSDLTYLADEIDLLEDTYKGKTVDALSQISMYFNMDGTTTHDQNQSNLAIENASILPFSVITDGIINSQSIPTEKTYTGTLPGESTETSGNISAAISDNISLGSAAWVEGKLIVGNGADNNAFYNKGYADGFNKVMNGISISYKYHEHIDGNGNINTNATIYSTTPIGGCYVAAGHTHNKTGTCGMTETGYLYWHGEENGSMSDGTGGHDQTYWWCGPCSVCGYQPASYTTGWTPPSERSYTEVHCAPTYICGYPINTYTTGCGKTANTIEEATIIFD